MNDSLTWVNAMRFGDLFWHCLYLSRIRGEHTVHCRREHHQDLEQLFSSHKISFAGMENIPETAIDCWIGSSRPFSWHAAYCEPNLIRFLGETWFDGISKEIGVENPFRNPEDFLYDGLGDKRWIVNPDWPSNHSFIVNAHPTSGQVSGFDEQSMRDLNAAINDSPKKCIPSNYDDGAPYGTMLQHGNRSLDCSCIAGIATGPMWPCISVANHKKPFYILLTQVRLCYGPNVTIYHFSTVKEMTTQMTIDGYL